MRERTRSLACENCGRGAQPGRTAVLAPRLNSNWQRTPWRFEPRHLAACSSLRSRLSAALAAIVRLFWSSSCTLAPNAPSSFPSVRSGLLVLQNRSIPLLGSDSSEFPLAFLKPSTSPQVVSLGAAVFDNVSQPVFED